MIPAHDSPLAALAFCTNGAKVATASEKGTVIRVFHVSYLLILRPLQLRARLLLIIYSLGTRRSKII